MRYTILHVHATSRLRANAQPALILFANDTPIEEVALGDEGLNVERDLAQLLTNVAISRSDTFSITSIQYRNPVWKEILLSSIFPQRPLITEADILATERAIEQELLNHLGFDMLAINGHSDVAPVNWSASLYPLVERLRATALIEGRSLSWSGDGAVELANTLEAMAQALDLSTEELDDLKAERDLVRSAILSSSNHHPGADPGVC